MLGIGHMAAGFIIGNTVLKYTHDPLLSSVIGFGSGVASHYILDFVPHGHFSRGLELGKLKLSTLMVLLDIFGGLTLFIFVTLKRFGISPEAFVVLLSIFGAILPDIKAVLSGIIPALKPKKGFLKWESIFHENTHWHGKGKNALLISFIDVWQAALVTISLLLR